MENKSKIDQLHDLMPSHFNTRNNINWNALITALGQSDQNIVELITEVKKQFFIKTAYRPYLDNLAAKGRRHERCYVQAVHSYHVLST